MNIIGNFIYCSSVGVYIFDYNSLKKVFGISVKYNDSAEKNIERRLKL